ncbi:heme ABC transporter ATP-binding protein [Cnuibacter physcomitrellae]|uniref:heme ABC transporter ATP-binding protein n=1 Tax=Cnuibacter physcomitrellae TaxID=1619308 RepID=UPI002175A2B0|nr:heme ABC transporter ATP-binding protein [Cnuibacter physcomitrellae]MCS5495809.1 heme ABC transporter ATP-binding protein [Cnuibacter physcomitrellae]
MSAVVAKGVSVSIGGARILDDVDLEARPGELLALVGPNGAGKSTLLGVISGDVALGSGTVEIAGRPLGSWTLKHLARERAVLLQQTAVSFPFTVQQVVEMGRAPWAGTAREADDDDAIADAVLRTDLARHLPRTVPSLSGGERARAALARILAQRTHILLLDEPTAALDIRHQEDVLRLARERADAGDAVIVVLHDLSLAAAFADRVCLLADGRVVADGPPATVFTEDLLSRVYDHPLEVLTHPSDGTLIVLPRRAGRASAAFPSAPPSSPALEGTS